MKVLVLNGSPKAERSNTLNITKAFLKGFPADTEVEQINLYKKDIKPCLGCFSCWSRTPGQCVIKDDMQDIYEKRTRTQASTSCAMNPCMKSAL